MDQKSLKSELFGHISWQFLDLGPDMQGQPKNTGFWLAGGTAQDGPAMAAAAAPAPAVVLLLGAYTAPPVAFRANKRFKLPSAIMGANKKLKLELPRQSIGNAAAARPALTT